MKICGVTRVQDARYAGKLGAWAVGVLLFSASPRSVSCERAEQIFEALPPSTRSVAVSDTCRKDELERILSLSPDAIQIYHPFALPRDHSFRVFRVFHELGDAPSDCDALVLDESHGKGKPFNSVTARRRAEGSPVPVILSGGLTPENVPDAIRTVRPCAVDVCSGVESSCGCKDPGRMRTFFRACQEAVQ